MGEESRGAGMEFILAQCFDRLLEHLQDDNVILTERGCDARATGVRISKATTRLAGMSPRRILMYHLKQRRPRPA